MPASTLDEQVFDASGKRGVYLTYADNAVHDAARLSTLRCDAKGLFLIKTKIHFPKLGTGRFGCLV